ncbi:MAG: L-rhamnose mutarotase [Acidobacteriota bacterium]|nr:L-rhamnose mutarotase [Acidobacteriota bacterium]
MKKFALTLDLKDDKDLIEEYRHYHRNVWPEIKASILASGIISMEIFLLGNRLCMFLETDDTFSFPKKADADASNPKVQEWEALMWKYQQPLPQARSGEKWMLMESIFLLTPDRP